MTDQRYINLNIIGLCNIELPLIENKNQFMLVPLKPITDAFKLEWKTQYKRTKDSFIKSRCGIRIEQLQHQGQRRKMTCIRLDRVATYINSVNPKHIDCKKETDTVQCLIEMQSTWDRLIDGVNFRLIKGEE